MEASLVDLWLADPEADLVIDEASVAVVRRRVRELGEAHALPAIVVESMAVAVSELAHNQLRHALSGRILVRYVERQGIPGLEAVAADRGGGLRDPRGALREEVSSPGGLGAGIAGVRRLVDEIDVDVRLGEGTCVWARKLAERPPFSSELAVFGRAFPGEDQSGDHAVFSRTDTGYCGAVVDGLGHGPEARRAARRAGSVLQPGRTDPIELIHAADEALQETRGAVMSAFRVDRVAGSVEHACIGNLRALVYSPRSSVQLGCQSGTLGARQQHRPPRAERHPFGPRDVLLVATDGLSTRFDLHQDARILFEHPVVIAQHVFENFSRSNDDALVLVAR